MCFRGTLKAFSTTVKVVHSILGVRNDLEWCFYPCEGPVKLVHACLTVKRMQKAVFTIVEVL